MQIFEVKYDCLILTDEDTEAEKLDGLFKIMQKANGKSSEKKPLPTNALTVCLK